MLRVRYYKINLNDNLDYTILIRVKKDFYTEGIFVDDNRLVQGYFDFYNDICLNILDDYDLKSTIFNHNGISGNFISGLSYVDLDEELIEYSISDRMPASIEEIEDIELIKKIDFLIRNNIKKLTDNNKKIYDFFNERRMMHFKELNEEVTAPLHLQNGGIKVIIDEPNFNFSREDLTEIREYLESLTVSKTNIKGRDENNKKVRKRKKK